MGRKYFDELARVLFQQGIRAELKQGDNLTVLLDGQPACHVGTSSQMYVAPGDMRTLETDELYHRTAPIAETVREYMTAIEKASLLNARDLDENFRLLAEYNGIILAGRETATMRLKRTSLSVPVWSKNSVCLLTFSFLIFISASTILLTPGISKI